MVDVPPNNQCPDHPSSSVPAASVPSNIIIIDPLSTPAPVSESQSVGVASVASLVAGRSRTTIQSLQPANLIAQSIEVTSPVAGPSSSIRPALPPLNSLVRQALTTDQQSELNNLDDIHRCAFCGKFPKKEDQQNHLLLACLHTICYGCFQICYSQSVSCPKCERTIDVSTVATHYYLMRIPGVPEEPSLGDTNCDVCPQDSSQPVRSYCTKCKKMLCVNCTNNHASGLETKEHLIVDADYGSHLRYVANKSVEHTKCSIHKVVADNYCNSCDSIFCNECDPAVHGGHDVSTVKEKANAYGKMLDERIENLELVTIAYERNIKEIESRQKALLDDRIRLEKEGSNPLKRLLEVAVRAYLASEREIVTLTACRLVGLQKQSEQVELTNVSSTSSEAVGECNGNDLALSQSNKHAMAEQHTKFAKEQEEPFEQGNEEGMDFHLNPNGKNILKKLESGNKHLQGKSARCRSEL